MTDRPMTDTKLLLKLVPGPLRAFCKLLLPNSVRIRILGLLPREENMARTALFWANPRDRSRKRAELRRCQTPEDFFAFATASLRHQQWKQEILGFLNFAKARKPVRICELGLFLGGTNLMLTHALPDVEQIIGVDLKIRNKSQLKYYAKPSQRQTFIEGKTGDRTTLEKVSQVLGGDKLDLLFIDADHSYAGARQDFMDYRHFVRDGGIIAFHDIVQDHLTRFGHAPATFDGAHSGEVYLLWKSLKPYFSHTQEFVVDYEQDGCGIGALIYSSNVSIPSDL